jgi:hypothetical protein
MNKVRPGVYVNFVSEGSALGTLGARGVATMALSLGWGDPKKIITLSAGEDTTAKLGYAITASQMLLIREVLKRAKTLLLYRLNTGTKATVTTGNLTATAKYGGLRGNDITIVIQTNVDDTDLFDVITKLSGTQVDLQTVADISGLEANDWVVFSGAGALANTAGAPLISGADGSITNQDHSDYLAAVELYDFNTATYTGTDSTLKGVYTAFAKRLREDEGKKIQAVMENYTTADDEGVISVKNGVILSDGTTLTAAQTCAWVAGATAAAQMNQSLTYDAYDDAVDVSPRYTNSQIITALQAGEFLFTPSDGKAVVEQDINSLTSFTADKDKRFAKNRVLRVLDGINNDFVRIFSSFYLGKVNNNADGRNLLKNECVNYLNGIQNIAAIQDFDSQTDITVSPVDGQSEAVYIEAQIVPVDSVEKMYVKVTMKGE